MLNPYLAEKIQSVLDLHPDLTPIYVQEKLDEIEEKIRFANLSTLYELFDKTGEYVSGKGFVKKRDPVNVHFRHRIKERSTQIFMSITGPESLSVELTEDLQSLIDKIVEAGKKANQKPEVPHFMALPLYSALYRVMDNS